MASLHATYLVLAKIVEQDLHGPMSVKILPALLSKTSPSKIWTSITGNSPFEILDLSDGIRGILRW